MAVIMLEGRAWPVTISASSEESLRVTAERLGAWLTSKANANGSSPVLPDLTYTAIAFNNDDLFRRYPELDDATGANSSH